MRLKKKWLHCNSTSSLRILMQVWVCLGHHNFTDSKLFPVEEQFEAGGEELRRHFSMDGGLEPEKLRAAPAAEAQRQGPDPLFTGDSGLGDDMMSTGNLLCSNSLAACSYLQKELHLSSVM